MPVALLVLLLTPVWPSPLGTLGPTLMVGIHSWDLLGIGVVPF